MKSKLLILHDSRDFGGHENMLLQLLPGVIAEGRFDIVFYLADGGGRLAQRLEAEFPGIRVVAWPFAKRRGEPYLRYFRFRYRNAVRRALAEERPDAVLLVQGRIENCAVPMSALPEGARLISYIPMAHRLPEMQRSGVIGDRLRLPLYRRPNRFIVPSEAVATQIRRAGGMAPISVVENAVDPPLRTPKSYARDILDLPLERKIALFLGRLDPAQKGLDRLTRALARAEPASLKGWTFLFVGEGPAASMIERTRTATGLDLRLVKWTDRPDLYLSSADVMLMPSRWEGLPLVMLEALHYGVPILASDIDAHRGYLPPSALIDFDGIDLAEALDGATEPASIDRFADHGAAMVASLTIEAARARFARALAEGVAA